MAYKKQTCDVCGKDADVGVTWADGFVIHLCKKDMPGPGAGAHTITDLVQLARDMIEGDNGR